MACLCRLQFFANCLAVGKAMALPTAWQSAKPDSWQILLCRLQEIPVGKGTSLPSVEKKQLAKKIAVGKEPVSCSATTDDIVAFDVEDDEGMGCRSLVGVCDTMPH
jgi:hypothetical protein